MLQTGDHAIEYKITYYAIPIHSKDRDDIICAKTIYHNIPYQFNGRRVS